MSLFEVAGEERLVAPAVWQVGAASFRSTVTTNRPDPVEIQYRAGE